MKNIDSLTVNLFTGTVEEEVQCIKVKYFDEDGKITRTAKQLEERGELLAVGSEGDVYQLFNKYYILVDE